MPLVTHAKSVTHVARRLIEDFRPDQLTHLKMVETAEGRQFVPLDCELDDAIPRDASTLDPPTEADARILESALSHLEAARALPMPVVEIKGTYHSRSNNWRESLYRPAKTFVSCQQCLHFAQTMAPFDHREDWSDRVGQVYHGVLSNEFPLQEEVLAMGDNPKSVPHALKKTEDGVLHSLILFWHARMLCFCLTYVQPLKKVVEIGGGYGALARLWLKQSKKVDKYVIIDLPESLFYAEVALRDEFGDEDIGYWQGQDPGTRVVLVPVTRLEEFQMDGIDLIINTGSMQEMSDHWVSFYMQWLDVTNAKFFYSLNYMGHQFNNMYESRTFWAPRPSDKWSAKIINGDPPLVRAMSPSRDFCEILYERDNVKQLFWAWSVLKGQRYLTRATFLEGLDLLRKDFSAETAAAFLDVVTHQPRPFAVAKEVLYICNLLKTSNVPRYSELLTELWDHEFSMVL